MPADSHADYSLTYRPVFRE